MDLSALQQNDCENLIVVTKLQKAAVLILSE
jgi:hypothetical protein